MSAESQTTETSRKRGRPKGPCSPQELAQRRAAPYKTGQSARTVHSATHPPCKPDLCPLAYPCDVKRQADERGIALGHCPVVPALNPAIGAAYLRAIQDRDHDGLRELTAEALANQHRIFAAGQAELLADGLSVTEEIRDAEGNLISERRRPHPAAISVLELSKQLGMTADAQQITPKSRDEGERDRGFAGFLEGMRGLQQRAASKELG